MILDGVPFIVFLIFGILLTRWWARRVSLLMTWVTHRVGPVIIVSFRLGPP